MGKFGEIFSADMCAEKFSLVRIGAEWRVPRVQTRELGPSSVLAKFYQDLPFFGLDTPYFLLFASGKKSINRADRLFLCLFVVHRFILKFVLSKAVVSKLYNSASADGGPRSRVRARGTLRSAPHCH